MQTFLISKNIRDTAKILDNKRLGKQRVEAIQIANILLRNQIVKAWKNHPAVLMWKDNEEYLVKVYLKNIMEEWVTRGYKNQKCFEHYLRLSKIIENKSFIKKDKINEPKWFCNKLFNSHKSNLVRKEPEYYKKFWPKISNELEYWWPTKNGF